MNSIWWTGKDTLIIIYGQRIQLQALAQVCEYLSSAYQISILYIYIYSNVLLCVRKSKFSQENWKKMLFLVFSSVYLSLCQLFHYALLLYYVDASMYHLPSYILLALGTFYLQIRLDLNETRNHFFSLLSDVRVWKSIVSAPSLLRMRIISIKSSSIHATLEIQKYYTFRIDSLSSVFSSF